MSPNEDAELSIKQIEEAHADVEERIEEFQKLVRKYEDSITIAKEKGDPETLSNDLIRLARVNTALGGYAQYAKYVARNAERAYRRDREYRKLTHIEGGMAIGKAESKGFVQADDSFKVWSEVQKLADQADDMAYRTDTFMKMSQSALSLIKKDIHG